MSIRNHLGTALITGASTGIGATYADRLARRGYDLILVARSREKLDALAKRITNETQQSVEVVAGDLNKPADLERVERKLKSDASITLLVNNAGVAAVTPLANSNVAQLQSMIELNVTALTRLTAAVTPGFVARGAGAIINIGSIVSVAPELLNGVYSGTKAYVFAFSQSLRHELSDKGIRVQVVLPGATATDLWSSAGTSIDVLPKEIVMSVDDLVDAALAGFDAGEFATVPALPDIADWNTFESARLALHPNLSRSKPAARYGF
jgi:short-subunit dehydrogenase